MQPFANFLQNRCYHKFPDIHKEMSLLESLFNKVTGLIICNFTRKETPTLMFSCEYHKMFQKSFFMEYLQWLIVKMVEQFLRISKGGLTRNDLHDLTNLSV